MGGKASRNKGKVGEYQARDYFRSLGMIADRVPSSGAAQGFPGDIKVIGKDGVSFLVEVKFRKAEFKSIYELKQRIRNNPILVYKGDITCILADTYEDLYSMSSMYTITSGGSPLPKGFLKLFGMQKWVKGSDVLMIKDNNKPFLFLRYLK